MDAKKKLILMMQQINLTAENNDSNIVEPLSEEFLNRIRGGYDATNTGCNNTGGCNNPSCSNSQCTNQSGSNTVCGNTGCTNTGC